MGSPGSLAPRMQRKTKENCHEVLDTYYKRSVVLSANNDESMVVLDRLQKEVHLLAREEKNKEYGVSIERGTHHS